MINLDNKIHDVYSKMKNIETTSYTLQRALGVSECNFDRLVLSYLIKLFEIGEGVSGIDIDRYLSGTYKAYVSSRLCPEVVSIDTIFRGHPIARLNHDDKTYSITAFNRVWHVIGDTEYYMPVMVDKIITDKRIYTCCNIYTPMNIAFLTMTGKIDATSLLYEYESAGNASDAPVGVFFSKLFSIQDSLNFEVVKGAFIKSYNYVYVDGILYNIRFMNPFGNDITVRRAETYFGVIYSLLINDIITTGYIVKDVCMASISNKTAVRRLEIVDDMSIKRKVLMSKE